MLLESTFLSRTLNYYVCFIWAALTSRWPALRAMWFSLLIHSGFSSFFCLFCSDIGWLVSLFTIRNKLEARPTWGLYPRSPGSHLALQWLTKGQTSIKDMQYFPSAKNSSSLSIWNHLASFYVWILKHNSSANIYELKDFEGTLCILIVLLAWLA